MNIVKIRKNGTFYTVFDRDCYILYLLFGYNIKNGKVGFPKSSLNKVLNALDDAKINYEVVGEDKSSNYKNLNKYLKYSKLGESKYSKEVNYQNILDKLNNLNEDKLDKILKTIESIINE